MCHFGFLCPLFFLTTLNKWWIEFHTTKLGNIFVSTHYTRVCMYLCMLIYMRIYSYAHTYIKITEVLLSVVHTRYRPSPCPSLPICAPQHFTSSVPHSAFRHPIFLLSADSQSLSVPPGGCSAQKFVLSWIFTIALQFTFTKINSPTWNFCNQQRDQNKQTGKQSRQRFSNHVNCTLGAGGKNGHHPNSGPCADAPLSLSRRSPVYPI